MISRKATLLAACAAFGLALGVGACDGGGKDEKKDAKAAADKKDGKAGDKKADAKADEKKADGGAPAGGALDLAKIGLKGEAPAGSKAGDAIVGEGVMVQGPGIVVTVEEASDSRPKTIEKAKEEADMYSPQNLKEEKLDDGFAMTFENKGGMGTNYFVNVRREIDGKAYWCETTASQPEQQENALKFCKSLKK